MSDEQELELEEMVMEEEEEEEAEEMMVEGEALEVEGEEEEEMQEEEEEEGINLDEIEDDEEEGMEEGEANDLMQAEKPDVKDSDGSRPQKRTKLGNRGGSQFPAEMEEVVNTRMNPAVVPEKLRKLRACIICGLVKTFDQFIDMGCDNCNRFVNMIDDEQRVATCTSTRFEGIISMMDSTKSWVARYQKWKGSFVPGCYAVSVVGELPEEVVETLENRAYVRVSRDFSARGLTSKNAKKAM